MKIRILYIAGVVLLISGCTPKVQMPQVDVNNTKSSIKYKRSGLTFNPNVDERYSLKPEPYSLSSQQKDPELLGPQSTLKDNPLAKSSSDLEAQDYGTPITTRAQVVSEVYDGDDSKPKESLASMSESECISIIGEAKFNEYVQKFGSKSAAIRRCVILKRLNG